jgi:hypothetical protein
MYSSNITYYVMYVIFLSVVMYSFSCSTEVLVVLFLKCQIFIEIVDLLVL